MFQDIESLKAEILNRHNLITQLNDHKTKETHLKHQNSKLQRENIEKSSQISNL